MTITEEPEQSWWGKGSVSAALLTLVIFASSIAADKWVSNAQLTLPLLLATVASMTAASLGISPLKALKVRQVVCEKTPKGHKRKSGTPTMGGLLIVPVGTILGGLITREPEASQQLLTASGVTLAYMVIGGFDDWCSLKQRSNTGLRPQSKLLLQTTAALVFLVIAAWQGWISSTVSLPFGISLSLGMLIWPLGLFVFLAESNATNLTDGLDGLASGCGSLVFTGLALQLMLRGNHGNPALAGFCMAMAGAWLGFLMLNRNPARIFMGDTGSLAMGAALSAVALLSDSLWPLLVMGGVFLAESLSVIIQVSVFKATKEANGQGQRLFRMAPLHHHFELGGMNERVVVPCFWLATVVFVVLGLLLRPLA
ncbi:phospho-N-acetylmuramoyl-pentapeptide-transferase [Synechococcus sp. M16CYN]|uniref:phospho-N-acetylmuramoyl-pentapeptide- transferase n=1 Tax=Synechococcus sp. M16CYN TaxID=3103139 RepID=UPI00325212BC